MGSNKCVRFLSFIALSLVTAGSVEAKPIESQVKSTEEAFLIRRIAEFWKDGDYAIVKTQISDFFTKYPDSAMKEYFLGILGDLELQEGKYQEALATYSSIQDPEVYQKIIVNKLQCYYELSDYAAIEREGRPFLAVTAEDVASRKDELNFLMGEAYFRQALEAESHEQKQSLAHQALPFYELLENSSYDDLRLFALAEINNILDRNEAATTLYLELAKKHPGQAEELLFQAATLQASFDKEAATTNFEEVISMNGARKHEATYNSIILLFEKEAYSDVLERAPKLTPYLSEEHLPTLNFMIGKSHFALDHIQDAIAPLDAYIATQTLPSTQLKNALLIEMTCARIASDNTLFTKAFDHFATLFAEDSELPKALFMHAMLLKESGNAEGALEKLTLVEKGYPSFEDRESLLFELAHTNYELENWSESRTQFDAYLKEFPEHERSSSAWKFFLSDCLHLHQGEHNYPVEYFYRDLSATLMHEEILSADEQRDCRLLQARIAYELSRYQESLDLLSNSVLGTIDEETHKEALAEAYFLTALNHQALGGNPAEFCLHVENALTLAPEVYSTSNTHLQLFNAYVSLSGLLNLPEGRSVSLSEHEREYVDHAAKHLYAASRIDPTSIKIENRLWLANHYYLKVTSDIDKQEVVHKEEMQRALALYSELLLKGNALSPALDLVLEGEVLKFAQLLGAEGERDRKLDIVQKLIEQQSTTPDKAWKFQKQALFELARTYEALGEREKALETFSFINNSQENYPSSIASIATLESARLQYKMLSPEAKRDGSEQLIPILNNLKELQIRKTAETEPLHLEAALEYAKIRSELVDKDEQAARHLFFLSRMREDFTAMDDVVVREYHESLKKLPAKQEIFNSYMKFVDAEIFRLQALELSREQKLVDMEEVNEKALTIYDELKRGATLPSDLAVRIQTGIDKINAATSY